MENNQWALPSEVEQHNNQMKVKLAIEVAKKIIEKNAIKIEARTNGKDTRVEFFGNFYIIEEKDLADFIRRYI